MRWAKKLRSRTMVRVLNIAKRRSRRKKETVGKGFVLFLLRLQLKNGYRYTADLHHNLDDTYTVSVYGYKPYRKGGDSEPNYYLSENL